MGKYFKKAVFLLVLVFLMVGIITFSHRGMTALSAEPEVMVGYGSNLMFLSPIVPVENLPDYGEYIPISTREDLEGISADAESLAAKYYLTNNIDLSGSEWIPLGDEDNPFIGVFDGQGYVISGLTITGEVKYAGLFASVGTYWNDPTIRNLGVETNIDIIGSTDPSYAGGIAARAYYVSLDNCYHKGRISIKGNSGDNFLLVAGGLIGQTEDYYDEEETSSQISNCYNWGNIYTSHTAGGIVGGTGVPIQNCHNAGYVEGEYVVGGILGSGSAIVKDCTNMGDIVGSTSSYSVFVGGIAGSGNYAQNCSNSGEVSAFAMAHASAGGVFGSGISALNCRNSGYVEALGGNYANAGGILGDIGLLYAEVNNGVRNCTNSGEISARTSAALGNTCESWAGGIVGYLNRGGASSDDVYIFENCTNAGNAYASGVASVGGMLGGINSNAVVSIRNCTNTKGELSPYEDAYIAYVGGIIGNARGSGYDMDLTITNCKNEAALTVGEIDSSEVSVNSLSDEVSASSIQYNEVYLGGILGYSDLYNSSTTISGCLNNGDINGMYASGGIAGKNVDSIIDCSNTGNIFGHYEAGGIAGNNEGIIESCCNEGNVNVFCVAGAAGGIAGKNDSQIANCYNIGEISAIGISNSSGVSTGIAGGIAGYGGEVLNCYNIGRIYAYGSNLPEAEASSAGGISGHTVTGSVSIGVEVSAERYRSAEMPWFATGSNYAAIISVSQELSNNLARDDIQGCNDLNLGGVTMVSTAEINKFYEEDTYTDLGWDFDTVWKFAPDGNLPILQWQNLQIGPPLPDWEMKILGLRTPHQGWIISGQDIKFTVDYSKTEQVVAPIVSYGASWEIFSDAICTIPVEDNTVTDLQVGVNTFYIKLTMEGKDPVIYTLLVKRDTERMLSDVAKHTITFHAGLADDGKKDVLMDIDWGWTLFNKSASGQSSYDNRLAIAGLALSGSAENASSAKASRMLDALGFTDIKPYNYGAGDIAFNKVRHLIARKAVTFYGEECNIFVVVSSGTLATELEDWITNINIWGYTDAKDDIYANLEAYLKDYYETDSLAEIKSKNNKFFVTGHSLGGAVSNLLSIELSTKLADDENIFVYTYASPLTWSVASTSKSNVHNIIHQSDIIPYYSMALLKYRIGRDIKFHRDDSDISSNLYSNFMTLTSGKNLREALESTPVDFMAQITNIFTFIGKASTKILWAHDTTTYMAYLISRGDSAETWTYFVTRATIKCPVNVEVYNKEGQLVGRIIDNMVDRSVPTELLFQIEGDKKYVYLPFENDYTFKLIGTDSGTMNFTIEKINSTTGEVSDTKVFTEVKLHEGKTMSSSIENDLEDAADVRLFALDGQGAPIIEISTEGVETPVGNNKWALTHQWDAGSGALAITCTNLREEDFSDCRIIAAIYNKGKLLALQMDNASVALGQVEVVNFTFTKMPLEYDKILVFALDSNFEPLTNGAYQVE